MGPQVNKVRLTVLIALLFSALCAGVFRTPPILFMAALLTSAPFVGLIIGRICSRGLYIERNLPESGMAGDVMAGEITVANRARWPVFLVHARCGSGTRPVSRGVPVLRGRGARSVEWSSAPIVPVGGDVQVVPMLRGKARASWKQQWHLRRRGVYYLQQAQTGVLDPLGLSNHLPMMTPAQPVIVMPRPIRIEQLRFLGSSGPEQQTPRHSTVVSDAMDLHGVRPWQPGEAIRRAHWKHTARTGQLHVIEWEETPAADLAVLLDVHKDAVAGDEDENTLETCIVAAASIACFLLENGCRFQLFYFAPEKTETSQSEGAARTGLKSLTVHSVDGIETVLRALAEIEAVENTRSDAVALSEAALPKVARGMGALMIASSRAPLDKALSRSLPGSFGGLRALIADADSFEIPPETKDTEKKPANTPFMAARRVRRPRGRHGEAFLLRRGESIAAALEGHS